MTTDEIEYLKNINLLDQQKDFTQNIKDSLMDSPQINKIGNGLGINIPDLLNDKQHKNLESINVDKINNIMEDEDKQSKLVADLVNSFLNKKGDNIDIIKLLSNHLNGGGDKGVKTKYLRKKKK
jgi:hypothetical protein